jgi:replicative DNA helicase
MLLNLYIGVELRKKIINRIEQDEEIENVNIEQQTEQNEQNEEIEIMEQNEEIETVEQNVHIKYVPTGKKKKHFIFIYLTMYLEKIYIPTGPWITIQEMNKRIKELEEENKQLKLEIDELKKKRRIIED